MTVGNLSSETSDKPLLHYVRLKNIPPNARQEQFREFFSDLTIPIGGVSIHRSCAFISFLNEFDANIALSYDKGLFDGKRIRISKAILKDVRRTQVWDVRRKLVFSPQEVSTVKTKKRIRPTKVTESSRVVASKKFCPDEVYYPKKVSTKFVASTANSTMVIMHEHLGKQDATLVQNIFLEDCLGIREEVIGSIKSIESVNESIPKDKGFPVVNETSFAKEDLQVRISEGNEIELLHKEVFEDKHNVSVAEQGKKMSVKHKEDVQSHKPRRKNEVNLISKKPKLVVLESDASLVDQSMFQKKAREIKTRYPTRKVIKPTPVRTLNQFNLNYEGTVF